MERIAAHLEYLGSDSLEGRAVGTEGGRKAAVYIAGQLKTLGLSPGGSDGTFHQPVPMLGSRVLSSSSLQLVQKGRILEFQSGSDYLLYRTGAQTFLPQPAGLVFAGYGIVAPEYDYNDYLRLDVSGKVVVVLLGEPGSSDPGFFEGERRTIYSYAEAKLRMALARGAEGVVFVPEIGEVRRRTWDNWVREFEFEHVTLPFDAVGSLSLLMNPAAAGQLFEGSGHRLEEIAAQARGGDLQGFPLVGGLSFHGRFEQREFLSSNVIGILRAEDSPLADQYLLVSSHYDHLGKGSPVQGDEIYNGVFDNASGVAVNLELARVLEQKSAELRRSIVFIFTTGEEKGLLGSRFYLERPVVPLFKSIANLNIDGVALWDQFRSVVGVGGEFSTLGNQLIEVADRNGYSVEPSGTLFSEHEAFSLSDQAAFAEAGIPSILILEGSEHRNLSRAEFLRRVDHWGRFIYHSPFDDLNQEINLEAARQQAEFLLEFILKVANSEAEPEWLPGVHFSNARLQSIAERR